MGKTFAFGVLEGLVRARANVGSDVWRVSFWDLPSEISLNRIVLDSTRWKAWAAGTGSMTFLPDGIDEELMKIDGFVGYLATELKGHPWAGKNRGPWRRERIHRPLRRWIRCPYSRPRSRDGCNFASPFRW